MWTGPDGPLPVYRTNFVPLSYKFSTVSRSRWERRGALKLKVKPFGLYGDLLSKSPVRGWFQTPDQSFVINFPLTSKV